MKDDDPDDLTLRRYLLGELPEEEEDEVERLLLEDDDLFELCQAVEAELLDDLEAGLLTPAQRRRVEAWTAGSAEVAQRRQVVRDLRRIPVPVGAEAVPETSGGGVVVALRPRPQAPRWVPWASLAAALLLLAGWVWLGGRERSTPPAQDAHQAPAPQVEPKPPSPPTPQPPPERQAERKPPEKPSDLPVHDLRALGDLDDRVAVIATILEIPLEVRRDGVEEHLRFRLKKGSREATLRFLFDLPPGTERFRLRLLDEQGAEVRAWNRLKVRTAQEDMALVVTVPVEILKPGRYGVEVVPLDPGPDDVPVELRFEILAGDA